MSTILEKFIIYAQTHDFIQQVGQEGSANNPQVQPDDWQDYDLTYFCTDITAFSFADWSQQFGEPVIYQHFNQNDLFGQSSLPWRTYLVRFSGKLRIDLKIAPVADREAYLAAESLNTIIWDRAQKIKRRHTSDRTFWLTAPTPKDFANCLNNFYWCAGNVVKGLARQNLLYANEMMRATCQEELLKLLNWQVLLQKQQPYNPGAFNKFLPQYLSAKQQQKLAQTYRQDSLAATGKALNTAIQLVSQAAEELVQSQDNLSLPTEVPRAKAQIQAWLADLRL